MRMAYFCAALHIAAGVRLHGAPLLAKLAKEALHRRPIDTGLIIVGVQAGERLALLPRRKLVR